MFYEEMKEKLQQEELPFWGNWMGEDDYPSIKAAREAGLVDKAEYAKYRWECMLALPELKPLGVMEYEMANFPEGEYMRDEGDWQIFNEIFDGKTEFSVEYLLERALSFPEPFRMLLRVVSIFEDNGYFDD